MQQSICKFNVFHHSVKAVISLRVRGLLVNLIALNWKSLRTTDLYELSFIHIHCSNLQCV